MTEKNLDNTAALEETALEEAYKEISLAACEGMEQPPKELLENVMQTISARDMHFIREPAVDEHISLMADFPPIEKPAPREHVPLEPPLRIEVKKTAIDNPPSFEFRLLTRYIPLVACLAVVLLTLNQTGVFNRQQRNEAMSQVAPANIMMDEAGQAYEEEAFGEAIVTADASVADIAPITAAGEVDNADDAVPAPVEAETREFEVTFEVDAGTNRRGYMKITAEEAFMLMGLAEEYVILDVRTEAEYSDIRIKDAILIPHDEISATARTALPDADQMIFVYCQSGVRSAIAAAALNEMGYTQVFDIGAITDWPYETEG